MASQIMRTICQLAAILACANAYATVSDVFPTPTTTNLEVQCKAGFSIGGGADIAAQEKMWGTMSPCRLHCQCVAKDGSCKYCCKNTGSTCERHLPLYKFKSGSCLKCPANEWLHEAGVGGKIGTSSVDSNVHWVARGSKYFSDLVAGKDGIRFLYYKGFVACWNMQGGGNGAQSAASCTTFEAPETSSSQAPVGNAANFVTPHLSPVLNQGGCGNCYIQAALATTTDRALLKMSSTQRSDWKTNARSYSTGAVTRCHYAAGKGDACDGGVPEYVMEQLAGKNGNGDASKPGMTGLAVCKGGVYGGPGTTTTHKAGSVDYYSKWAYGCNSGCTPFQAGFDGPPLPAGVTCPEGYTDDAATMRKGFLPTPASITANSGSNFHQYSTACGCGGTLKTTGKCTYCGAVNKKTGSLYPFGKWATIAAADCNYAGVSKHFAVSKDDFKDFGMTGEAISAWNVDAGMKSFAHETLGCPKATVEYPKTTKCTMCCKPMPYPKPGYQYTPEKKAAQSPKQCSGAGVTAGSSPGASVCSVGSCSNKCDSNSVSMPSKKVLFDDAEDSAYTPIGLIYGDSTAQDWHPMFEHFIKDEIAQHGPVAVGFSVTHHFGSFFNSNPTGIMSLTQNEQIRIHGGHAVSIVGWGVKDSKKYWLVRNSWGRDWADSGFFRMEIGGGVASRLGFGSNKGGVSANAALLKTGSFRRMNSDAGESKARKLAKVTQNKTTETPVNHGASAPCSEHHKPEVDALRTWFLKNKANYKGVSAKCAVPWEYVSSADCSAKIAKGMHVKTTLHVKDCNGALYHMTVHFDYNQVKVSTGARVLANTGPKEVSNTTQKTTGETPKGVPTNSSQQTASALRSSASFVTALFVVVQFLK